QTIPTAAISKVRLTITPNTNPPSITVQPQGQTLLEGGTIAISVGAAGLAPLRYQWQFNVVDIPNATNESLVIVPASTNDSGAYRVIVTNALGSITSAVAQVTVRPLVRSAALTPLWSVPPGSRYYLTTDNAQRGLAYNPATGDLLIPSRSPTNSIHVLSSVDGIDLFELKMDPAVLTGGTAGFAINMIGVSDDGTIYVCNLAQNAELFRIYRWSSEDTDTVPSVAFSAAASSLGAVRFGDTFDVRGSANEIQIIAASRNSNVVVIFTTTDNGVSLLPNTIVVPGAPNSAFGLGVSFDGPDTFWGKGDSSTTLRKVQFELGTGIATVLQTYGASNYPPGATVIGVEHNLNVLAAFSVENPDNLRLYDISDLAAGPRLVDQELFPTDNDNINGTGAIDYGEGKVFALDSNNGIMALQLGAIPPPAPGRITIIRDGGSVRLTWSGAYTLQAATLVTGPYEDVVGATSGYTETTDTAPQKFFRLRN
ncbi:MAG TPA: immunoglobulin domain-containing protein, partial [Methylomirabilota bacterium]|nr:immunoglobulin domain-containing protein [Methylomirabilota bacterium]